MNSIKEKLFELADENYREFHARLMPTVSKEQIIGVRIPLLRKFAKEIAREYPDKAKAFCEELPHLYCEENNLHAFLIEQERDFDKAIEALDLFLPFVDNWATCDSMIPKTLENDPERLILKVRQWLASAHTYTVRFGINILMKFFLNENFKPEYAEWVAELDDNDYYVMMGAAWYFATALAKQYDEAVIYLENKLLDVWTHNKTIQKSVESLRIDNKKKSYLKTLKTY
jgi:3-methyladenine DNA glycosylase AlkD